MQQAVQLSALAFSELAEQALRALDEHAVPSMRACLERIRQAAGPDEAWARPCAPDWGAHWVHDKCLSGAILRPPTPTSGDAVRHMRHPGQWAPATPAHSARPAW